MNPEMMTTIGANMAIEKLSDAELARLNIKIQTDQPIISDPAYSKVEGLCPGGKCHALVKNAFANAALKRLS